MRTRGTRGGVVVQLSASDDIETVGATLSGQTHILTSTVFVEVVGRVSWPALAEVERLVREAGGEVAEVRPEAALPAAPLGETVIVSKTVRSGMRVEATGSAIIFGDVNAGAEVIANGDIVVLGLLRGLAHAGASGNEHAIIWAQTIIAPQLRIAGFLAQSGVEGETTSGPEIAKIVEGQIVLQPWGR